MLRPSPGIAGHGDHATGSRSTDAAEAFRVGSRDSSSGAIRVVIEPA